MKITAATRYALKIRRERRDMEKDGWEFVGERGGSLWEFYRGGRCGQRITDVRIAACGRAFWIKSQ